METLVMNENVVVKRRRGRPSKSRTSELQRFVVSLQEQFPGVELFTRDQLQTVGDSNMIGMTQFTSDKAGFGKQTRVSRGTYMIPANWLIGQAPWNNV